MKGPFIMEYDRIEEASRFLRDRIPGGLPSVAVVLGSGLGGFVDAVAIEEVVPYEDIPGFWVPTVEGHAGRFVFGRLGGRPLWVMQGRAHLYEGVTASSVVFAVRTMVKLGVTSVVITNAAGAVNPDLEVPGLMLLSDQLNLTGTSPLLGPNEARFGPRFPDMTEVYDSTYRRVARECARKLGWSLSEGVYAGLLGPAYETPAEVRMLRALGADAVGMSTVLEALALRHMGARVLGLSCLTNLGAGLSPGPLSHDEVKAEGAKVADQISSLLKMFLAHILGP